eukprot:tig00020553_g10508.t1
MPPEPAAPTLDVGPAPDSLPALGVLAPNQLHARAELGERGAIYVRLLNPADVDVHLEAGAIVAVAEARHLPPGDFEFEPPSIKATAADVADAYVRTLRPYDPRKGQGFRSLRRLANNAPPGFKPAPASERTPLPHPNTLGGGPPALPRILRVISTDPDRPGVNYGQTPQPLPRAADDAPPPLIDAQGNVFDGDLPDLVPQPAPAPSPGDASDDDDLAPPEFPGHYNDRNSDSDRESDSTVEDTSDSELDDDYPGWTDPEEHAAQRPQRRAERRERRSVRNARRALAAARLAEAAVNAVATSSAAPVPAAAPLASSPSAALAGPSCSVRHAPPEVKHEPDDSDAPSPMERSDDEAPPDRRKGKEPVRAPPRDLNEAGPSSGPPRPEPTGSSSSEEEEWNRLRGKIPEVGSHPGFDGPQKARLEALLKRYKGAFAESVTAVGGTQDLMHYQHVIRLNSHLPVYTPPRRVSPHAEQFARAEIARLLELGLIQPSEAAYGSPLVLAPKKDGTWRMCVDYRRLNAITERDVFPLPRIDDQLDRLRGAIVFSVGDAVCGFWQLPLDPASRRFTAFVVPWGQYEWRVTPFGVTNGPAAFSRAVTAILGPLLTTCVTAYIDDITVFSPSIDQHLLDLEALFKAIVPANLRLKPSKCRFGVSEINLLGHLVSAEGIRQDPAKLAVIRDYPAPTDADRLRSFLGLAGYYRRFVEGFARIVQPMQRLLLRDAEWNWGEAQQASFEKLKAALLLNLVLKYPDFERPFILSTDASTYALGAILSQLDGSTPPVERPIGFISRTLAPAERNYSATELECLAVVWAIKYWRHFLLGGPQFTVRTDHHALQWLRTRDETTGRLGRWALLLQSYDFVVEYRAGRNNGGPDACSRLPGEHPVLAPGGADGSSDAPEALPGARGFGVPRPGDLDEPLPLYAVTVEESGEAASAEAPAPPAEASSSSSAPGPELAPVEAVVSRRMARLARQLAFEGAPASRADVQPAGGPRRRIARAPPEALRLPLGAARARARPAVGDLDPPQAPAEADGAALPAAPQLPHAGPPQRRGQKQAVTWAQLRAQVDEWHQLAVGEGLPPRPRSPSPPPAPEPMELDPEPEPAPPVMPSEPTTRASLDEDGFPLDLLPLIRPRHLSGPRRYEGETPPLPRDQQPQPEPRPGKSPRRPGNPRHWRCGPPIYPHQDDPDEGPEGGAGAVRAPASSSSTTAATAGSEGAAASEAPSSGQQSSGPAAAGAESVPEMEMFSSSAVAPGPELGEASDRRKPRVLERVLDAWDCVQAPKLDGPIPEALKYMFPARRVRLLAAQRADSLGQRLFAYKENGTNYAQCSRASCLSGDCYACLKAKASFAEFAEAFDIDTDGVLVRRPVLPGARYVPFLPESWQDRVMYAYHDGWGHRGAPIVARRIALRFWWPGMLAAVTRYVRSCACCQFAKAVKPRRTAIAVIEPEGRNDLWQVDIFHLDPTPRGLRYMIVYVNAWSKWHHEYPIADLEGLTLLGTARKFVSDEGVPLRLLVDNGSNLKGGLFNEFFRSLGTRFIYAAAYHHATNGLVERLGGVIKTLLHAACRANREPLHEWDQHVHEVQLALRTTVHAATGFSPAVLHLGHELTLPADVRFGVELLETMSYPEYLLAVVRAAKHREAALREHRRVYRQRLIHRTGDLPDRRRFEVGDKVLCWLGDRDKGLYNSWVGPFTVLDVHPGGYTYVVRGLARPYGAAAPNRHKSRDTRETIVHIDCMIPFRVRDTERPARPARGRPRAAGAAAPPQGAAGPAAAGPAPAGAA